MQCVKIHILLYSVLFSTTEKSVQSSESLLNEVISVGIGYESKGRIRENNSNKGRYICLKNENFMRHLNI